MRHIEIISSNIFAYHCMLDLCKIPQFQSYILRNHSSLTKKLLQLMHYGVVYTAIDFSTAIEFFESCDFLSNCLLW